MQTSFTHEEQSHQFPPYWQDLFHSLSPMTTREQLEEKCPLIRNRTYANLDSQNMGIPGRMRVGKTVCYPRLEAVKFLMAKVEESQNEMATKTA